MLGFMIIITVSLSLSLSLSLWHREKEREREREGTRYLDYLLPFFQRPDPTAIIMSSAHLLYRHHCSHTILSFALNHPHQKPQSIIIIIISRCKKEKEQKGERKRSQTCCTCVCKRRGISRRFSFLRFIDRAACLLASWFWVKGGLLLFKTFAETWKSFASGESSILVRLFACFKQINYSSSYLYVFFPFA